MKRNVNSPAYFWFGFVGSALLMIYLLFGCPKYQTATGHFTGDICLGIMAIFALGLFGEQGPEQGFKRSLKDTLEMVVGAIIPAALVDLTLGALIPSGVSGLGVILAYVAHWFY